MQINDECEIVILLFLTHDSCNITISVVFFANFMHACKTFHSAQNHFLKNHTHDRTT